jgi:hypothetical protein
MVLCFLTRTPFQREQSRQHHSHLRTLKCALGTYLLPYKFYGICTVPLFQETTSRLLDARSHRNPNITDRSRRSQSVSRLVLISARLTRTYQVQVTCTWYCTVRYQYLFPLRYVGIQNSEPSHRRTKNEAIVY